VATRPVSTNGHKPATELPGAVLAGFYKKIECPYPVVEGSPPLWAEIQVDFPWDTLDRLSALGGPDVPFADVFPVVAPLVRAWNATAVDLATGERVAVPAPAEAGPDALRTQAPFVTLWLWSELRQAPFGGIDRPKDSRPSASTPES
jgi:hypothetical protein